MMGLFKGSNELMQSLRANQLVRKIFGDKKLKENGEIYTMLSYAVFFISLSIPPMRDLKHKKVSPLQAVNTHGGFGCKDPR